MVTNPNKQISTKLVCLMILILNAQVFMLPKMSLYFANINTYHNKLLITFLVFVLFTFWLLSKIKNIVFDKLDLIISSLFLLMFILLIIQLIASTENPKLLFSNFYYNLILLLYFPLKDFFSNKNNRIWFIRVFVIVGLVFTMNTIVLYYFFQYYVIQNDVTLVQLVNNQVRFPQTSDLIGSTILFTLIGMKMKVYSRTKATIILIICMYCLIQVSNVRMIILTSTILIASYFYMTILRNKEIYAKILFDLITIVSLCIILLRMSVFERFVGIGQQQASVFYRFEVINHYMNHFFDNILFGFGYSDDVKAVYNYTDIGIMGFLFRYGIIMVVWLIFFIKYFIKSINNSVINKLILTYFLMMSISLSLFDAQRIIYFPIIVSILSYSRKKGEVSEI